MFNISTAPAERASKAFSSASHVLVLASAIRLGFQGLDAAVVVGHVRSVHSAQQHAHRSRNRRLAIPLSRKNTIWMRWRCAAGIFQRSAVLSRRTSLLHLPICFP
jgi:hypothetical protein